LDGIGEPVPRMRAESIDVCHIKDGDGTKGAPNGGVQTPFKDTLWLIPRIQSRSVKELQHLSSTV
jgi:hypothetical protein